jgi:hypothetical protein
MEFTNVFDLVFLIKKTHKIFKNFVSYIFFKTCNPNMKIFLKFLNTSNNHTTQGFNIFDSSV